MRKIGFIVDGQSEYAALPPLLRKIQLPGTQLLDPLLAPIQPYAGSGVIAQACHSRIQILIKKGVSYVIVLLDREQRNECPGQLATDIVGAIDWPEGCTGCVVVKDRTFENWLIADIDALRASPKRFIVTPAVARKIAPNKADSCDGLRIMKDITRPSYSKVADSKIILAAADPRRIARNSRSFRKLLRMVEGTLWNQQF